MSAQSDVAMLLMDRQEALTLTANIKHAVEDVAQLIADAHDREAWRALGYESWAGYVSGEFPFTRQRSYQLVDQGRAMRLLAAEVGRPVEVTAREAQILKKEPQRVKHVGHLVADGVDPKVAVREATHEPIRSVGRERVEWADEFARDEPQLAGIPCPRCGGTGRL